MLFFSFFRFWFWDFRVVFHPSGKVFVCLDQRTHSVSRLGPPGFEVRCAQMAKADAIGRSLCATSVSHAEGHRLVKRSAWHGKKAPRVRGLPPLREQSPRPLWPACL